jgi:hypothetical protein
MKTNDQEIYFAMENKNIQLLAESSEEGDQMRAAIAAKDGIFGSLGKSLLACGIKSPYQAVRLEWMKNRHVVQSTHMWSQMLAAHAGSVCLEVLKERFQPGQAKEQRTAWNFGISKTAMLAILASEKGRAVVRDKEIVIERVWLRSVLEDKRQLSSLGLEKLMEVDATQKSVWDTLVLKAIQMDEMKVLFSPDRYHHFAKDAYLRVLAADKKRELFNARILRGEVTHAMRKPASKEFVFALKMLDTGGIKLNDLRLSTLRAVGGFVDGGGLEKIMRMWTFQAEPDSELQRYKGWVATIAQERERRPLMKLLKKATANVEKKTVKPKSL